MLTFWCKKTSGVNGNTSVSDVLRYVKDHCKKLEVIRFSSTQGFRETGLCGFYHSFPSASHPWGVQGYFYVIDSVAYKIVSELITVQMMFYYIVAQCIVKGSRIITVNVRRYSVWVRENLINACMNALVLMSCTISMCMLLIDRQGNINKYIFSAFPFLFTHRFPVISIPVFS